MPSSSKQQGPRVEAAQVIGRGLWWRESAESGTKPSAQSPDALMGQVIPQLWGGPRDSGDCSGRWCGCVCRAPRTWGTDSIIPLSLFSYLDCLERHK